MTKKQINEPLNSAQSNPFTVQSNVELMYIAWERELLEKFLSKDDHWDKFIWDKEIQNWVSWVGIIWEIKKVPPTDWDKYPILRYFGWIVKEKK